MEPVTHILTGAVLARAGFNRRAAYATIAMAIAAELPDIDTLWSAAGPIYGLEHHRGITHTFLAAPVLAGLVTAGFYLVHRHRSQTRVAATRIKVAPVHWGWFFAGTVVALLSHLLLDWTNNYGLRPFFPFNAHWYAGSFVFIFEPVLFAILVAALVLPSLFGLINAEVGSRKAKLAGRPSAILALIAIAAFYLFRVNERDRAIQIARQDQPTDAGRIFASPHPLDPFLWHMVTETPSTYQLSTVDTRRQVTWSRSPADTLYKPETTIALLAAKRTFLGRIYLDWSQYPVLSEAPDQQDPNHPLVRITFADARFLYNASFLHGREHPPLSGSVLLDMQAPEDQRVVEQTMDGRVQH